MRRGPWAPFSFARAACQATRRAIRPRFRAEYARGRRSADPAPDPDSASDSVRTGAAHRRSARPGSGTERHTRRGHRRRR